MKMKDRIIVFSELGSILQQYLKGESTPYTSLLDSAVVKSYEVNPWFTPEFIRQAIRGVSLFLKTEVLTGWVSQYPRIDEEKKVACILAGNIPMVGFHDMLCVLISGHYFIGKLSNKDAYLLPAISRILSHIDEGFEEKVYFTNDLQGVVYDAVIATGSTNTSRYFEQYFGHLPHIIRKGMSSVAILTGNETVKELEGLADDLFLYFGLGCRNISKLYIPQGFDITTIFTHFEKYSHLKNHHKWANNYDYNRAIMLVNLIPFYETGFALFTENDRLSSPISVIHYEYYEQLQNVKAFCDLHSDQLQCVVSNLGSIIMFGEAQFPQIDDYADRMDTLNFLTRLK